MSDVLSIVSNNLYILLHQGVYFYMDIVNLHTECNRYSIQVSQVLHQVFHKLIYNQLLSQNVVLLHFMVLAYSLFVSFPIPQQT